MTAARLCLLMCVALLGLVFAPFSRAQKREGHEALAFVTRLSHGAKDTDKLPLLIAMHGLGDRPEAFVSLFDELPVRARVIAARAPDPWGDGFSWYPIDDGSLRQGAIRRSVELVMSLAKRIAKEKPTVGKPVVTGFSQGGVLSFAIAATSPDKIHAALPIAGSLDDALPIQKTKEPPTVYAFHGENDRRIPIHGAEAGIARLRAAGFTASLTRFEDTGHTIPRRMTTALFSALSEALTLAAETAAPKSPAR